MNCTVKDYKGNLELFPIDHDYPRYQPRRIYDEQKLREEHELRVYLMKKEWKKVHRHRLYFTIGAFLFMLVASLNF